MGKIKKIIDSLNYQKQVFVKLWILVTVPMAAMGLLSCYLYIRSETVRSRMTLNSYSDEVSREYENMLSVVKEYYIDKVNGEDYRWLIRQEQPPYSAYSNLKRIQMDLSGSYFLEKYINNYEFINVSHGWVLNNYGLFPYEEIKNREDTDHFLQEQSEMPLTVYWLNQNEVTSPMMGSMRITNSVDSSGLNLILKGESGTQGMSWLLSLQINDSQLQERTKSYQNLGYDITILANDKVLLETNPQMTQKWLEHGRTGSGYVESTTGNSYNMNAKTEIVTGLTYVVGYDTTRVTRGAMIFLLAALAVIVVFMIISVIVRLVAIAFAKPLLSLEQFADSQSKQIKELLVLNLIKGELQETGIETALEKSEIQPWAVYRMIALACKNQEENEGLKKTYETLLAELPQEIRSEIFITPVSYHDRLIFLIGAEQDIECDNKTALLYKEIKDYIKNRFGFATASGISQIFHTLKHVRRAYHECSEALYSKINKTDEANSSLALFDDYMTMSQPSNVYDIIMVNELLQSISSGNYEEAVRLLELVVERMDQKSVVGIEREFYLTRLITSMMNLPASLGIPLSDVFDSEQYHIISRITQIYEKTKVVESISLDIIQPIIALMKEENQEGRELEIIKQVMMQIRDTKGNISLNECADLLSYHPNYLSKVLKKAKGMTFTDIANEERMKQAKYMLLTTEYSVTEISERLQYNNVQNFIRFFKNQTGITPAAFRKEHRK